MKTKSTALVTTLLLLGCGKVSGQNKSLNNDYISEIVSEYVCEMGDGNFDEKLEMCLCQNNQYFDIDAKSCETIDFESISTTDKLFSLTAKNKSDAKYSFLEFHGDIGKTTFSNHKIPNILSRNSNLHMRYIVDKKGIKEISKYSNYLASDIAKRSIKPKFYALTSTTENFAPYVEVLYYEDFEHLNHMLERKAIAKEQYNTEVRKLVDLLKNNFGEKVDGIDDKGCNTFCSMERELGKVKFYGEMFIAKLDRQYAKAQIVTKNIVLYPLGAKRAKYVVTLDYSLSPNLIYKMINSTKSYENGEWELTETISVKSALTMEEIVKDERVEKYETERLETQKNSVIMCDAGLSSEFINEQSSRINYGPYKTSILGWVKDIGNDYDKSYGVTARNKYNLGGVRAHADVMIEKHNLENMIPIDFKYCFSNFSKLRDQFKKYDSDIVNLSMSFIGKKKNCMSTEIYKTIKNNPDFLWIVASGNEGVTFKQKDLYYCPQSTDLDNTLIIGSSNRSSSLGEEWVDIIYPDSDSTSEAALLTSHLLRSMKIISKQKLTQKDLKKILLMTADEDWRATKSKGVINPQEARFVAKTYKGESAEEILIKAHGDRVNCKWSWNNEQCKKKKVLEKFKKRLKRYQGEL
jgi:hypothetical protein